MMRGTCTPIPFGFFLPLPATKYRLDALVRAIFTSDIAKLAADTQLVADVGDYFVIEVQVSQSFTFGRARPRKSAMAR